MTTALYRGMEWTMRFAYVQLLWLVFTIAGLGIFGVFPATVCMYTVMRKWLRGESEAPILETFKKTWRSEWKKANLIGLFFLLAGFVLYFYLRFAISLEGIAGMALYLLLAMALFIYGITFLFVFPAYVHFQSGVRRAVKLALIFALSYPFHSVSMLAAVAGFYFLAVVLPAMMPFISFSLLGFSIMFTANLAFLRALGKTNRV
ncbi:YesL family protein [Metabacillus sp. FJAT-52054]|uniref:YesL family protein n=1 Tax=Metabacillus sediminis TaxID=3117746 RepID=A0ABZ2NLB4_9BACI